MPRLMNLGLRAKEWAAASPDSVLCRLVRNPFLRKVGVLSRGSAMGHLFTLAAGPILTRLYGPREFGALGLFTSFLSVTGVGVALQYEASILSASDEQEAAYLTLAAVLLSLPTSLLSGLALLAFSYRSLVGYGGLEWYYALFLSLAMAFIGIFTALRYWSLRRQQFGEVARATVIQSAARAILQTIIGGIGYRTCGLVIGETLGRGMGMSRMLRTAWPELRVFIRAFSWYELKQALWRNRKFPFLSMPSSLMDSLCFSLTLPLLVQNYGAQIGGYYSLVWRAIALPSVLITLAIADTFHSRMAICARETPEDILPLFKQTSVALLLTGLIPAGLIGVWGEPIFRVLFGVQWGPSGIMAAIIAPWYIGQFVVQPVSRVVLVLSGQEVKLVWDVLALASIFTLFHEAHVHALGPLQAVRLLSAVNTLLYAIYFVALLVVIARHRRRLALETA